MATVRRRKHQERPGRITPAAIEAYRAGNWPELHRELRLKPWEWGEAMLSHPHVLAVKEHLGDADGDD